MASSKTAKKSSDKVSSDKKKNLKVKNNENDSGSDTDSTDVPKKNVKNQKKTSDDVELEDGQTKASADVGLVLSITNVSKWMKEYYAKTADPEYLNTLKLRKLENMRKSNAKKREDGKDVEDTDEEHVSAKIGISGANIMIAAAEELLFVTILDAVYHKIKKSKSGLYTIQASDIESVIDNTGTDLNLAFGKYLYKYDESTDYFGAMGVNSKTKKSYLTLVEKQAFSGGSNNVQVSEHAFNLLMFICLQNRTMLSDAAYQMMTYARKARVDYDAVIKSVNIVFKGKLKESLSRKLNEKKVLAKDSGDDNDDSDSENEDGKKSSSSKKNKGKEVKGKEGKGKKNSDSDEEDEKPKKQTKKTKSKSKSDQSDESDEEVPAKKSSSKSKSSKPTKKGKKVESEDESGNGSSGGSDEDDE